MLLLGPSEDGAGVDATLAGTGTPTLVPIFTCVLCFDLSMASLKMGL